MSLKCTDKKEMPSEPAISTFIAIDIYKTKLSITYTYIYICLTHPCVLLLFLLLLLFFVWVKIQHLVKILRCCNFLRYTQFSTSQIQITKLDLHIWFEYSSISSFFRVCFAQWRMPLRVEHMYRGLHRTFLVPDTLQSYTSLGPSYTVIVSSFADH